MSSLSPMHRLATQHFDERYKHKQRERVIFEPGRTHRFGLITEPREPNIYIWVFFFESSL